MQRDRQRGFTLIELIITFALVAVMLVLAAPSFIRFQRNSELTSTANDFVAAVSAARSEAMKSQRRTIMKPLASEDWSTGWIVFVDVDNDGTQSSGDILVTRHEAMASTVTVTVTTNAPAFADGSTKYISFNGSGFLRLNNGSFPSASALDIGNTNETRRVIVSPAGRLRVCKPTDDGCNITSL
jgi:type IV fimbrial biogenesis protein FimT